jgi:prefoldin subunit 5
VGVGGKKRRYKTAKNKIDIQVYIYTEKRVSWGERLGKIILVPLTTSLYVPGTMADTENVIVDIGTGFYVEKVR